jgi:hypothetical protein
MRQWCELVCGNGAAFVVECDAGSGQLVVVREDEEPLLGDGEVEESFALVDAADGVEIVAHDPGGVEVVVRGEEVAGEDGVLVAGCDADGEHVCGVAGEGLNAEAGEDFERGVDVGWWEIGRFGIAEAEIVGREAAEAEWVEQVDLAIGEERIVVGAEVADPIAVVLQATVRELAGSEEVAGVGEGWGDGAVGVEGGVPAAVVEVEVGIEDVGDVFGADAGGGERGGEEFVVLVDLAHFGREFVAQAGFDDDERGRHADDEGVEAEEDAVLVVGRGAAAPERFGDDAEHGTAVEEEGAVGAESELERAEDAMGADQGVVAGACGGVRRDVRHRIRLHEPDGRALRTHARGDSAAAAVSVAASGVSAMTATGA